MLYYFKKGKNATETKKICAAYGEGSMTDWMCQKWFVKFSAGDFFLDDVPRSCRPVEVETLFETLIENNQLLYHTRDSWHTQNIQINKVIDENKKCIFYFMEKTKWTFEQPSNSSSVDTLKSHHTL